MTAEQHSGFEQMMGRVSEWAGAIAVASGIVVLAGWALRASILQSFFPGQTSMRPNSALAFILSGVALWMLCDAGPGTPAGWRRWLGNGLAAIVLAIGALTFSEYLTGINLGIDHLLFYDPQMTAAGLFPGRMTPAGALNFAFLGSGLLLLDWNKESAPRPAEFLALALLMNGMFGWFNFVLGFSRNPTGIAVNSSLTTCVLAVGVLAARPYHQARKFVVDASVAGMLFRRVLPASILIPSSIGIVVGWGERTGLFAPVVGLTLFVVLSISTLAVTVTWTTRILQDADVGRRSAVQELRLRVRQEAAIAELGHIALTGTDLASLMDIAVRLVARTLGVEFCKIQELVPDGKALVLRAGVGWSDSLIGRAMVAAGPDSQSAFVLRSDHPVIVEDLRTETRFRGSPLLSDYGVISGLSVMISGEAKPFGVLGAHSTQHRHFTRDDIHFLDAVSNVLAAAIDRKRAEDNLRRFNRALRTLSACDLAMVRAASESELLQQVSNTLVDQGGYRMAWVAYAEQDEAKTIRPVAVAGADEGYLESARITWADETHGRGPTGTAIRTGTPCVVRNILEDENFAPWREDAVRHGYASTVALPLVVDGQALGALRVYSTRPDAFDDEEMALLSEMAGDLAYGVQALRTRVERARAAEELRQSEERFRQMAENIREVLWMVDPTGTRVLYISPASEQVWGRPPQKLYDHALGWLDAIHPEDRHRVRASLGGDIPQRQFEAEFRVVWPDGSIHWICDRSFPLRDAAGQIQRIVGISEDVTERRLAAEELMESEERFRHLFTQMKMGCALFELVMNGSEVPSDVRFVEVNPAFEKLTRFPRMTVIGKGLLEIFPGAEPSWVAMLARVEKTGESVSFEGYSDLFRRHFVVTALRLRDGQVAVVFADVTERKQALEALERAERKYRSIFENAMEGIFQVREDGSILTANPAMARLLGYASPEEFIQQAGNFERHLFIEPSHPSGFIPLLKQQGAISEFETQMRRGDGTLIWVIGSAHAVCAASGKILHYEGTLRDITEHKKAEEACRQLSSELLHAQDDERRRIARELHDSTGQALAALAMNLSWIRQSHAAEDSQVQAVVEESIELVKRTLSEIRNFSYLLHPPMLDEYGLSAALQSYVQGFSKRSGIRVDLDLPPHLPRLSAPTETALFRIVQECLTNVHRHSGSASAAIHLRRSKGNLTLEVADGGKGMACVSSRQSGTGPDWIGAGVPPAEAHTQDPHATHPTGSARVGVGIAGIRARMRELGGRLEIESDSHGTTVRASLPVALEEVTR